MINRANVAYNYQKNPYLDTSNKSQALAGLAIALRDNTNFNRNVNYIFPINMSTPNLGAGSPTVAAISSPKTIGINPYAGSQVSGLGEIT